MRLLLPLVLLLVACDPDQKLDECSDLCARAGGVVLECVIDHRHAEPFVAECVCGPRPGGTSHMETPPK